MSDTSQIIITLHFPLRKLSSCWLTVALLSNRRRKTKFRTIFGGGGWTNITDRRPAACHRSRGLPAAAAQRELLNSRLSLNPHSLNKVVFVNVTYLGLSALFWFMTSWSWGCLWISSPVWLPVAHSFRLWSTPVRITTNNLTPSLICLWGVWEMLGKGGKCFCCCVCTRCYTLCETHRLQVIYICCLRILHEMMYETDYPMGQ